MDKQRKQELKSLYKQGQTDGLSEQEKKYISKAAGGWKRAENSVKVANKYVSNKFANYLKRDAKELGQDVEDYVKENEKTISEFIQLGFVEINLKSEKVATTIGKYSGDVYLEIDGELKKAANNKGAALLLQEYIANAKEQTGAVEILTKIKFYEGQKKIIIPVLSDETLEEIVDEISDGQGSIHDAFTFIISPEKSKKKK